MKGGQMSQVTSIFISEYEEVPIKWFGQGERPKVRHPLTQSQIAQLKHNLYLLRLYSNLVLDFILGFLPKPWPKDFYLNL